MGTQTSSKNKADNNTTKITPLLVSNTTKYMFFWKSNKNPFDEKGVPIWTPYDEQDSKYLEKCYQKYINNEKIEVEIGEYKIYFKYWIQIHKTDTNKQRPIKRDLPDNITNIMRKNR